MLDGRNHQCVPRAAVCWQPDVALFGFAFVAIALSERVEGGEERGDSEGHEDGFNARRRGGNMHGMCTSAADAVAGGKEKGGERNGGEARDRVDVGCR